MTWQEKSDETAAPSVAFVAWGGRSRVLGVPGF